MNNPTNPDRDEALLNDLEALHNVSVPDLRMPAVPIPPDRQRRMHWRPAALTAAAIAGLALFAGGFSPFGGSPTEVSAETILQKTAGVAASNVLAAGNTSYHMVSRTESFWGDANRAGVDSETEVWYRDAEHQRSENRNLDGDVHFGTVQSGSDIWMYSTVDGETRAVHGNVDNLGFRAGIPGDFGADSLADLLSLYSGGGCSSAKLAGEEEVAGRDTYVIEVRPTWETCPFKVVEENNGRLTVKGEVKTMSAGTPVSGEMQANGAQFVVAGGGKSNTSTRMWVDSETFINLRTETYAGDELLFRHEVTEFETGIDIPDAVFAYTPPAGVQVVEATNPQEMKGVLSRGIGIISIEGGGQAGSEPVKIEAFEFAPAAP